ncbi:MAG: glycosyltransferase family 4 protein [Armatimonadota bacterium]|nr:glycosyltransferase family 4 protein [Armatimonadota bacterium]
MSAPRPLVLASSRVSPDVPAEVASGQRPRLDVLAVAQALDADVLDTQASDRLPRWQRRLEAALATDWSQARAARSRRGLCSAYLSTSEKVGLPLALQGVDVPHVLIAHNLMTARKRRLHRMTGVLRRFDAIICLSATQEEYLRGEVGLEAGRVHRVWDGVDQQFFRPSAGEGAQGDYLLAVGRENRDYQTLVKAARRAGLPLTIVASSLWSRHGVGLDPDALPPNVTLRRDFVSYPELRTLYENARLVVVPLAPCDYAAGVNGVLEAMAMGKASVVTQTNGLAEYVQDGVTNRTVPPGDVEALADALRSLWADEAARRALGTQGRARVEREMSMDAYAARLTAIVRQAIENEQGDWRL